MAHSLKPSTEMNPQPGLPPAWQTDPQRQLARLARLETLLLAHHEKLQSRQAELQARLAQAGLDTPEKLAEASRRVS